MFLRWVRKLYCWMLGITQKQLSLICVSMTLGYIVLCLNIGHDEIFVARKLMKAEEDSGLLKPFRDFNTAKTRTGHLVCLTENENKEMRRGFEGVWYADDRMYFLPLRQCKRVQKYITVYQGDVSNVYEQFGMFQVEHHPIWELPASHTIIENQTAYFLSYPFYFEPMNFFHFTKQIYFSLYWLIKSTNQLYDGARNVVFYPGVFAQCPGKYIYHDLTRYRFFRQILHVEDSLELSAFSDKPEPRNVCYRNAVISPELFTDQAMEAIEYFKKEIGVEGDLCTPNILVIINRSNYRRILNIDELKSVSDALGYDTRVVSMENLTLKEQAQLIHCTKILAGVVGAGLQWAYFMKNHSGVIEIAWPHAHWPFFFTGTGGYNSQEHLIRPLNFARVPKVQCSMNPEAINIYHKDVFYLNSSYSYEESVAILKDERNFNFWNHPVTSVGKLCDIIVDPETFRNAILSLQEK